MKHNSFLSPHLCGYGPGDFPGPGPSNRTGYSPFTSTCDRIALFVPESYILRALKLFTKTMWEGTFNFNILLVSIRNNFFISFYSKGKTDKHHPLRMPLTRYTSMVLYMFINS